MKFSQVFLSLTISLTLADLGYSQDIPLFNQKITNSFLYNPAITGLKSGSIGYSYRKSYGNVDGAPVSNLLDFQIPIHHSRFGTGVIISTDEVNFIQNSLVAAAFAYHLRFKKKSSLSMGVSGEYDRIAAVKDLNFSSVGSNPAFDALRLQAANRYDFSFGLHFNSPFFQTGVSMNRLSTALFSGKEPYLLTSFYSVYTQLTFLMGNKIDRFEPFIAYRKLAASSQFFDIGMYYVIKNKITLGLSYKTSGTMAAHLVLNLKPNFLIAYTSEQYNNSVQRNLGSTNEINFKYLFNRPQKKERYGCIAIEPYTRKKPRFTNFKRHPAQFYRKFK